MKDLTVLVTGAGAPGAPGIIKALHNNGERKITVVGIDINPFASGSVLVDKFIVGPKYNSPSFVQDIINICKEEDVNVIHPLVTRELNVFSRSLNDFRKENIVVCVMENSLLERANNKARLLEALKANGVHVPAFRTITTAEAFEAAVFDLGYPGVPVCFKPSESNGSRGFRILDKTIDKARLLFDMKPNTVYADFDDIFTILSSMKELPEIIVMEYLPGHEYSVDMLVNKGNTICAIPRKRLTVNQGISVDCVTEKNNDVIEYCSSIARCLDLHGNIGIQVKYDANNIPQILEINPRLQGSVVNCVAAGVNLPYLGAKLYLGEDIAPQLPLWGVRMVRRWEESFIHAN